MLRWKWTPVLAGAFSVLVVSYALRYGYGVVAPPMALDLALTNEQVGSIVTSYFVAYAVFTPLAGFLADKFGFKRTVALFTAVMGVGSALMSTSTSFEQCIAFFFIVGVGAAAAWAPMATLARRLIPSRKRGLALGIIDSGSSVGYMISSFSAPPLIASFGWRSHWTVWSLASLAVAASSLLVLPSLRVRVLPSLQAPKSISFWLIALSYMMFGVTLWVPLAFLSKFGLSEVGLDYWAASLLGVAVAAASIPGKLLLSHLSDVAGRSCVLLFSLALIGLSQLLCALAPSPALLFLYAAMFGLGYGGCVPLYGVLASDFSERAGTVLGLWTVFFSIGSMASPKAAGFLADLTGGFKVPFLFGFSAALTSMLLLALASRALSGKTLRLK